MVSPWVSGFRALADQRHVLNLESGLLGTYVRAAPLPVFVGLMPAPTNRMTA